MISISLCMIVKNEEDTLFRCLDSVTSIVDEIIIVDTGSTDNTKDIARKYTDKVYDFKWIDDFSAARNYSLSKASKDYCMWLDADDIIKPDDAQALLELKETLPADIDIVMMKYHVAFDENDKPTFSYYRERIFRNNGNYHFESPIHEVVPLNGKLLYKNIAVSHKKLHPSDPNRNLNIFEGMIARGITLEPRQLYYYSRELYYHKRYEDAITNFEKFLNMEDAWIENKIEACKELSYCYELSSNKHRVLQSLLKSLEFDKPRAEICCEIGRYFLSENRYETAAFWYELASKTPRNDTSNGFILPDCYDYIPYISLCVCYDHLGDREAAVRFNEKAGRIKPQSPAYLANKKYFEQSN